jgi:hypothetical protein
MGRNRNGARARTCTFISFPISDGGPARFLILLSALSLAGPTVRWQVVLSPGDCRPSWLIHVCAALMATPEWVHMLATRLEQEA